jgi:heptosyltransferase III
LDLKRILVFRIGHLGDTLVSLPAFWAIRKSFPDSHLTLLSNVDANNPEYVLARSVLPENVLFDDWLNYPFSSKKIQSLQGLTKLLLKLRLNKYDAVVYMMTRNRLEKQIKRDIKFFRLAGIKHIFGAEYLRNNLLDRNAIRPLADVEPESEFLLKCLTEEKFLQINDLQLDANMKLSVDEENFADNWLKNNCDLSKHFIAVAPASKWESKVWAEERFAEVIMKLIDEKDIFPIIFGGKEEREKGERLIKQWGIGANAAGELNIRQAASALQKCELYVGNDTGTMHLAASAGTKCVAIFAAIDFPNRWIPFGEGHKVFRETVECEGCYVENCFNNRKCLDLVSVEKVYNSCIKVIDELR